MFQYLEVSDNGKMCRKVIHRAQVTPVCYALCYPFKRQLKHFGIENCLPRCVKLKGHRKDCKLLKKSLKIPKRYPETVN